MELGLRVVRGPDWKWQNQDDGEGHMGTVVEIGKPSNSNTPDRTVVVQWDSGFRTNYRVGYQGAFDLRVLDNAPAGVRHQNIACDSCSNQGVQGMRWKCSKCHDFDLCHDCYMSDKHDLSHPFTRYDTASSTGVKVAKRAGAVKIQSKGVLAGARVVRGPDWDWGNQDGGEGMLGTVSDIRGWDSESGRSVANVTWSSGSTNVYRLGHKGKVDLKYIEDGQGGTFYKDHLPVLGESTESCPAANTHALFKIGDKVRVDLDVEILKAMQEGHGGWNPRMAEYVAKVGTVHRITERGDVRVQFDGCSNRWTFHAGALTKVYQFSVGDCVVIRDNAAQVKDLQKGHGEWTENMRNALGKVGKVLKVYADGDLRVSVTGQIWTFNPMGCTLTPQGQQDENNTLTRHDRHEPSNGLTAILAQLLDVTCPSSEPETLVREAVQGHLDIIKEIIEKHPEKVDEKSSGKTALQVASHQGHVDIVRLLLTAGANVQQPDDDGDTALHYSAFGNQPEITELLVKQGASLNTANNGGCSALQVAVNKQHVDCVKVLLKHRASVNLQDSYGDTALHDAIGKASVEVIELLVSQPGVDFTLKNNKGFNVLHHAALKGHNHATERILQRARQAVDVQKDDGFTALHLAALNGHRHVASTLITQGKADLEICNNRCQTALLLAVSPWSHGDPAIVELLVSNGARLDVEDEDGNTCVHLALMSVTTQSDVTDAPAIAKIQSDLVAELGDGRHLPGAVAVYLVAHGADLRHKNHKNKVALDLATDPKVIDALRRAARKHEMAHLKERRAATTLPTPSPGLQDCIVCWETAADVTFEPCGHKVSCRDCCVRMKKCLKCQTIIAEKRGPDGAPLTPLAADVCEERRQLRELQRRMQEMEDTLICSICLEHTKSVAFLCGHSACTKCAQPLRVCHMCRKPIQRKINLFS